MKARCAASRSIVRGVRHCRSAELQHVHYIVFAASKHDTLASVVQPEGWFGQGERIPRRPRVPSVGQRLRPDCPRRSAPGEAAQDLPLGSSHAILTPGNRTQPWADEEPHGLTGTGKTADRRDGSRLAEHPLSRARNP